MQIIAATSDRVNAQQALYNWAHHSARHWGWDTVIQAIAEVMGYTAGRQADEKIILRYVRGVGWPALLREVASWMEADGVYLDVFCSVDQTLHEDEEPENDPAVGQPTDSPI